jgi:hypothetical protein
LKAVPMAMAEGLTAGKSWEWGIFVLVETLMGMI